MHFVTDNGDQYFLQCLAYVERDVRRYGNYATTRSHFGRNAPKFENMQEIA